MDTEYQKGIMLVAFGAILFAPDSLMLRLIALDQWPTLFWRGLVGGGAISVLLLFVYGRSFPSRVIALGRPGIAFIAVFCATSFCFVFAVRETSVANTLFLMSTSPVFSAIISWIVLAEPPDRRTVRTIVVALFGTAVIAYGGAKGDGPNSLIGDLAALGAAAMLASSFVIARSVRPLNMTPLIGMAGLVSAAIAAPFVTDFTVPAPSLTPLLVMGLLIMPIATWCLALGPQYIPAPEVSLLMLIEAILGPLIVWWVLSEYPGDLTLIGGAIVLGAISWSSIERLRSRRS
ncbi:MAG: DMT family transporter [Pseudomonadota bacterium]